MVVSIKFRPRYVRWAHQLGADRNESFDERGWNKQQKDWGVDSSFRSLSGVLGELAFAQYADLQIDSNIYPTSDGGADFVIRIDGEKLATDIKTRQTRPDRFWVKEDRIKADLFVLAYLIAPDDTQSLEGWEVELIGTATKDELLNATRVYSDYDHYNRSIWLEDLHPIPDADSIEPV